MYLSCFLFYKIVAFTFSDFQEGFSPISVLYLQNLCVLLSRIKNLVLYNLFCKENVNIIAVRKATFFFLYKSRFFCGKKIVFIFQKLGWSVEDDQTFS